LQKAASRKRTAAVEPKTAANQKAAASTAKPSARDGRVLIGGHFDVSVRQRLLAIRAAHPKRTTQGLLEEALDLLFQQHKHPGRARCIHGYTVRQNPHGGRFCGAVVDGSGSTPLWQSHPKIGQVPMRFRSQGALRRPSPRR
jgi:hypothetical protein